MERIWPQSQGHSKLESCWKGKEAMKGKISLPGLLLGALTALTAGLLISHYSFGWMVLGVALGMLLASALGRRGPVHPRLSKGEQR